MSDYERVDLSDSVTIYRGDCRDVLPTLTGIDAVVTDPPYGIKLSNHDPVGGGGHRRKRPYDIANDDTLDCASYIIDRWNGPLIAFAPAEKPYIGEWGQWLIWDKGGQVGMGGEPTLYWKKNWELVLTRKLGILNGIREPAVLRYPVLSGKDFDYHPCQKPVALLEYLIGKIKFATILDPFMGSGTTGIACIRTDRKFIGIEIDPGYFAIARRRLEDELAQGRLEL